MYSVYPALLQALILHQVDEVLADHPVIRPGHLPQRRVPVGVCGRVA